MKRHPRILRFIALCMFSVLCISAVSTVAPAYRGKTAEAMEEVQESQDTLGSPAAGLSETDEPESGDEAGQPESDSGDVTKDVETAPDGNMEAESETADGEAGETSAPETEAASGDEETEEDSEADSEAAETGETPESATASEPGTESESETESETELSLEEEAGLFSLARSTAANGSFTMDVLGEGGIPVFFDLYYSSASDYEISSRSISIKAEPDSDWETFSCRYSNVYYGYYVFFSLEANTTYQYVYNMTLKNGETAYVSGTVATGAAQAGSAVVTGYSSNLMQNFDSDYNGYTYLSDYATSKSSFGGLNTNLHYMADYGHYFYLGWYSYVVSPTVVGDGTVNVYFDMGYYRDNKEMSGYSASVNLRKSRETEWLCYNNSLTGNLPLYALEANTTYEFCYVLNVEATCTPYVKGTLTTGDTAAQSLSVEGYGGVTLRSSQQQGIYSGDANPASDLFSGSYVYLGDYDYSSSTTGIEIITNVPINADVRLYSEEGWEIPAGYVFTGGADGDQPYSWHYYITDNRTYRYVIEADGYQSAAGTLTLSKNGSQITGYEQEDGYQAAAVDVTEISSGKISFELLPEGGVIVTLDNTIDQHISIVLYDDEGHEVQPVSEGGPPSSYSVEIPDYGEDGSVNTEVYHYVMSAEGYLDFTGYFGITSDGRMVQTNPDNDTKNTVACNFNANGYYIGVQLIPQTSTEDPLALTAVTGDEIDGEDGTLTDGNHIFVENEDGSYTEVSTLDADSSVVKLSLTDALNETHSNAEAVTETGKTVITNDSDTDWVIIGYYCYTKNEDGTYNHTATLRVTNYMNCDLYGVDYGQDALTMAQLVKIEDKIAENYAGKAEWAALFGEDYSYYNYLVYWFRNASDEKLKAAGITGDYSEIREITSLSQLSLENMAKIISPESGLDVWYNYDSYREIGMEEWELEEALVSGTVYQSQVLTTNYAPYETDRMLDELVKAMAYTYNYSFALDGSVSASEYGIDTGSRDYVTYQQYESGVGLDYLIAQLGTNTLYAGDSIILSNLKNKVEVSGYYSNVFQESSYTVNFGLYMAPVWKLKVKKLDEETKEPLAGVTFEVTSPDGSSTAYTTDADGLIDLRGTATGTYTIRETAGLDGYLPGEDVYQATITATTSGSDIRITNTTGGEVVSQTDTYQKLDDAAATEKAVTLTVTNKKASGETTGVTETETPGGTTPATETEAETEKTTETETETETQTTAGAAETTASSTEKTAAASTKTGAVNTGDETPVAGYLFLLIAAAFAGEETFRRRKAGSR